MSNTIEQYRDAKSQYLKLRNQAKKELIARFNELSGELLRIQRELLEDFGEKIVMPIKPKKAKPVKAAAPEPPPQANAVLSPKLIAVEKQIERTKKKLTEAETAKKPTKALHDRIYELEDDLRLLQEK